MGVVHRADELALQRDVALKVIRPEHSGEARFRERFRRESMAAASIDHPNVIPILDAGEEDGVLYITMRLVEGTDLRALLAADGALEPARAARIIRQVGGALDAAHARGLVHRDIKPANVLLARGDHVYLSDFGLAKRAEEAGGLTARARSSRVPSTSRRSRSSRTVWTRAATCTRSAACSTRRSPARRPTRSRARTRCSRTSTSRRRPRSRGALRCRAASTTSSSARWPRTRASASPRRATSGRRRWSPPASSAGRTPSRSSPPGGLRRRAAMPGLSRAFEPVAAEADDGRRLGHRGEALRWAVALGFLAVLAVAMVVALNALSTL